MDFSIPPLPDAKLPKSAFIKPGDKVWDASGPFRNRGITFDHGWVCWNDTAKLMIGRGDPIDLSVFAVTYPVYDQRMMIRTTWEWWTAPEDAWHVDFNSSKPVHRLNNPKHQTELTLELEANINEADDFDNSLTLEGAVPDANQPAIRFKRTERIGTVNKVPLTLPFYESQNGDSLRLRIRQDLVRDQDSMAPPPESGKWLLPAIR
jgi:hypothetical protein